MPEYENTPLEHIAGNVGRNPETKSGRKGDFTVFSVAVNRGYGDEPDATQWYSVMVNDERVQAFVHANIRKGTPVVLEGRSYKNEYGGKTYDNFTAYRVGTVDWFVKGHTARPVKAQEDEDL